MGHPTDTQIYNAVQKVLEKLEEQQKEIDKKFKQLEKKIDEKD
jgi:Tfp pilus assembly protein PilN